MRYYMHHDGNLEETDATDDSHTNERGVLVKAVAFGDLFVYVDAAFLDAQGQPGAMLRTGVMKLLSNIITAPSTPTSIKATKATKKDKKP